MLAPLTLYTATVTGAKSLTTGIAMVDPYVWSFTTGARAVIPAVTSVSPVNDTAGVPINTGIVAAFSEPMAPITGDASFVLTCAAPCTSPTGTVTLDATARNASFKPSAVLLPLTVYTATITGATSLATGNALIAPYVWQFTTGATLDTTRPSVISTVPATTNPGPTTGVATNSAITATFSEQMAPTTINSSSFTITCASPCTAPAGAVSYSVGADTAVFTPAAPLDAGTTYTATITTAATDLAGNALAGNQAPLPAASNYVWTFTTAPAVPPTITSVSPANNAIAVPINTPIAAAFSEQMAPIRGNASFLVTCTNPCTSPTGVVALDSTGRNATFTPAANLSPLTLYTATITGATSLATGTALAAPYSWQFTTGAASATIRPSVLYTVPVTTMSGPTTGVATNSAITATFSEQMAPATITGSSFTLTCATPCTAPSGTVSYSSGSETAAFTPAALLQVATTYTATITTAATDLAGNALAGNQAPLPAASNYVWTFTTAPAPPKITVSSTNPTAGQTGICPTASVNATFLVPSGLRMDPSTVDAATFTLTGPSPATTSVTAATVSLDVATGTIATFTPLAALAPGVYTATVVGGTNGVMDLAVPPDDMLNSVTWTFTVAPATGNCLTPVSLGTASTFGDYGGTAGTTNTGTQTMINGNIGTVATATSSVTGFNDTEGDVFTETLANIGTVNGTIYTCTHSTTGPNSTGPNVTYCGDAMQARLDVQTAYAALAAKPAGPNPGANLGSQTLLPGVYTTTGSFVIQAGNLTLDAGGNANAVWVFQMATTLTVGGPGAVAPASVILVNGAQAKNVFWQVGSAATINAAGGGTMVGTIIAQTGVAISTAANVQVVTLNGRALSLGPSVTLVDTVINVPAQ
jgi:hypothetical protein